MTDLLKRAEEMANYLKGRAISTGLHGTEAASLIRELMAAISQEKQDD